MVGLVSIGMRRPTISWVLLLYLGITTHGLGALR
jgi:hypothetical protein